MLLTTAPRLGDLSDMKLALYSYGPRVTVNILRHEILWSISR